MSLIPTFGVLLEPFFEGNNDTASTVMNLFTFLSNLTILATGFLVKDLSARNFVFIGSSMVFLGLLLTSWATSVTQLLFTFSIMIGVGIGFLNPAAFVAVLSCFTCKRVYAISIGFAALGLGQMFMPLIVKGMLADYNLPLTFYTVSGLSVFGIIGASFLVPIKWKSCVQSDLESHPLLIRESLGKSPTLMEIIEAIDLDLLWNFKFVTIMFGFCVVYSSSTNLTTIFPIFLKVNNFA